MIKLTIESCVLAKLKTAMPKTDKAEKALTKYKEILEQKLNHSLLNMHSNMFRFFKHFLVSTHALQAETGQFRIDGKKTYLHTWLEENGVALIQVVRVGLKGSDPSTVKLSSLAAMDDAMDINTMKQMSINQLDALLNDKTLNDEDFFYRMYPDFLSMTASQLKTNYDTCPVDIKSLKQFIVWLTHKADKLTEVGKQLLIRQSNAILRIANAGNGDLPQKKNPSHFGRNYYHGINVQSVHRSLRQALLGNCYEYDLRTSVITWKMGFSEQCYLQLQSPQSFEDEFPSSLAYLDDKKKFRDSVKAATFSASSKISDAQQTTLIKQALTALSFGARIYQHGWIDRSGKEFNPAIVQILKNPDDRKRFINCALIHQFRNEQKKLDSFIFDLYTSNDLSLLNDAELKTSSKRTSRSKVMAYLYQHAETIVMDMVRTEVKALGKEVIANVHDAIVLRQKLSSYEKQEIEHKLRVSTGIKYWMLEEDKIKGYTGISAEVKRDELEHKLRMAALEHQAKNYRPKFF